MYSKSKRVTHPITHPIGFILAMLLTLWAAPAQAQLLVAADIQLAGNADRKLTESTSVAASSGDRIVIEVFASGFEGSLGFEANFQLSDPSTVTAATGSNAGGAYGLSLPSNITGESVNMTLGGFGGVTIPAGDPQYVGSLTLTLGQLSTLTITLNRADPGTGPVSQNIVLTVGDSGSLPIISGATADLNALPNNQDQTSARINPGRVFPIQVFGQGLQDVTSFEIQLQMDDPSNFDINNMRFEARAPFSSGSSNTLPTPSPSSSKRVAADIVMGAQGDNQYNPNNLSITGQPGSTVAVEFYGTGYQEAGRFVTTVELSDPSVVGDITIIPASVFPVKLEEPVIEGNLVTASLGVLGSASASTDNLNLLGTMVINLNANMNDGLGIAVKTIAFESATSQDVVTSNAVLTITTAAQTNTSAGSSTIEISGNTITARATSRLPVSGSNLLGTFGLSTSNTFRGGQITLSQVTVSSDAKSTTLEPGSVLRLNSVVSNAPVVVRPPVPLTVTDTRAIIQWATNVNSTGKILYGTTRTNLDLEAEATSLDRVHTARLSGLTLGTRYFFQVTNTDDKGTSEAVPPQPAQFVTRSRPDNQPPRVLRGPVAFGVTNNRADIVLETDEAAVVEVLYGIAQNDLSLTVSRSSSELAHKLVLENLTPGTQYFYRAKVTDLNGNSASSDIKSFTARTGADNLPPRILGRPSLLSRSFNATVVQWFTDEPSNSTVIYGTDATALTDTTTVDEAARDHKVSLGNLLAGEKYFFQIKSADASGNAIVSPIAPFTTSTTEDTQAPRFVRPPVVPRRSNTQALVVFETNEPTTAAIQYATTTDVYTDDTGTVGETVNATDVSRRHEVTLTNLDPSTRYYFKVQITDLASNGPTTNPGQRNFATRSVADTSPPVVFSRPVAQGITSAGAIIRWGADEPHSAVIRFGPVAAGKQTTSADLTESIEDINFTQRHAVTLADLTLGTTYAYEVETTDAAGNMSTSTNLRFTTKSTTDTSPPVIVRSPVARNITSISATIDWVTDEISDSRVSFGTSTDYTNVVEEATGTANHSITLTNLEPGTVYHYAVGSADQSGNVVTTDATGTIIGLSKDYTFRTLATEDTQAPVITEGPIVEFTDQLSVVKWTTDELATSRVTMGVAPGTAGITDGTPVFGETSELVFDENTLVTKHAVTVTGLSAGANYLFQVSSTDASGNTVNTSTPTGVSTKQVPGGFGSFTTSTQSDSQFPVITGGPTVIASTSSSLTVEWETDESANSNVLFGTSAENLDNQEISGTNVTTHRVVLTKLAAGTTYSYEVASTDASGNGETRSKTAFGTTPSAEDLTAPVISTAPSIIYKNDRSATIQWITNEAANAEVAFGTAANELTNIRTLPDFETEHTVTLTNLDANTTYHFKASSTDQSNNGPTTSSTLSFTTESAPDTQNPTISDISTSIADSTAIISWKTDEVSDSAVRFGTTSGTYGFNAGDATDVSNHTVTLTNLQPNTTYFYVVESIDRSGNGPAQSAEGSFTTVATGDVQAPDPPSGLLVTGGNAAVKLFWSASPSSGVVGYTLERSADSGDFAPLASLDPVTSYVDNNVTNGTSYSYRLAALGLKQLTSTTSTASESVTPSADGGPSAPTLFGIQGNQLTPTIVINNSTPLNTDDALNYTFHLATSADFSDAVALEAGLSSGAGTGTGDPSTVTAFTVARTLTDGTTYHYRVKASDGTFDSAFLTGSFTANASFPEFPGDLTGDKIVGFVDFLTFIGTFNKSTGQDGFLSDADLTSDGTVGFVDFLTFIGVFNKQYINGESGSGKPVIEIAYGENTEAQFELIGRPVTVGETTQGIAVDVKLANATDLMGYGVRINYDPATVQFIDATDKGETFLKTGNRQAELFGTLEHNAETGEVFIAGAITNGSPVEGQGVLTTLQFQVLDNDPQKALIEIAQGLLIDGGLNPSIARNLGGRFALVPTEYALEHNFPNPFNPETTLKYAIPSVGDVTLIVYNVLGQEIVRLVDTKQTPGFYAVRWNGQDALGRGVASGVYLYRIQANDFNKTHKMLLLK